MSTTRKNRASYSGSYSDYYSHSSEAVDVYRQRTPRPKQNKKRRRSLKPKAIYRRVNGEKASLSFLSVVTISIIFIGILGIVLCVAFTIQKQNTILSLNTELKKLQEDNLTKSVQITQNRDLKEIEAIAKSQLQMSKPKAHQIMYIDVPKQNYVVQSRQAISESENIVVKLVNFWKSLVKSK